MYFNRLQALGMATWREAADCGARRAHEACAPARGAAPARVSRGRESRSCVQWFLDVHKWPLNTLIGWGLGLCRIYRTDVCRLSSA